MRQSVQLEDLLPREVWSITTALQKVLDLSDGSVLASLGVGPSDLTRPRQALTQQIGEAAHQRGIQAIKTPSATGVDDVLALFPENLGATPLHAELVEVWKSTQDVHS